MPRETRVLFNWMLSSYFGWGIYGLNLLLAWADRSDLQPATLVPFAPNDVFIDQLDRRRIALAIERSAQIQESLRVSAGGLCGVPCLVLHSLSSGMPVTRGAHQVFVEGAPSVGIAFWEHSILSPEAAARLREYPLVIAGSTWNRQLLEEAGAPRVETVLQGVDTSHFHPAPRRNLFPGRFVVFSGGKLEFRKGQDLALRAFKIFAERHRDALLLTCWGSPWPQFARDLGAEDGMLPPPFLPEGQLDLPAWTRNNGVPDRQAVHLGAVANQFMPRIMREADVAVFPNRAEGGTNLVAMECMACGIPVILSANTGHLDLLEFGIAASLDRQASIPGEEHIGWGKSDVDELVAALEAVYEHRESARQAALACAGRISRLSWAAQMNILADLLLPMRPER